jgi:Holliday junction resolvase RusA-like endonuclease
MRFIINLRPMGKARPRVCRGKAHMPPPYMRWKKAAAMLMMPYRPEKPIDGPVFVGTYFATRTGNCQSDTDNAHSAILDVLQDAGFIHNDKQVKDGEYAITKGDSDTITIVISTPENK